MLIGRKVKVGLIEEVDTRTWLEENGLDGRWKLVEILPKGQRQ